MKSTRPSLSAFLLSSFGYKLCPPLLLVALFGLFAGSAFAAEPTLDQFFESFALEWTRGDPQQATLRQTFQGAEQDALDRQLTPVTDEYRRARDALAQRGLAELRRFDRARSTARQRLHAATLEWQLAIQIQGAAFRDFEFPLEQWNGVQVALVDFLTKTHPLRNPRDFENYLARLAQVGPRVDDACTVATARAQKDLIPPRFILTATIEQMERFLEPAPRQNIFVTTVAHGLTARPELGADARLSFEKTAERLVADSVQPAYRRAITLLRGLLPRATDAAGLWRFQGGDAAYAHALRLQTSTDLTADQIREIGQREVARLEREMDPLLRGLGLTEGTVVARMRQLDEQSFYPEGPNVREKILADYDRLIRDAEQRCASLFDLRPKAAVVVRRESEFSEQNASANYREPAKDGSRPGIFRVPLPGPRFPRSAFMRSTTYHETVPGHHYQLALMQEMADLPRFVREQTFSPDSTNAYGEGWALYAEQLAAESGWYDGDVRGRLGQLDDQLFRARRLVIDPGLHTRRWTRQQAIDYGFDVSEVERYVVWPGQACSYLVGMLKILELREKARTALGAKFSLREFHNVILRTAAVPLPILERAIDDYLQAAR
jgi:uncharacterized protein (DUF885 family)